MRRSAQARPDGARLAGFLLAALCLLALARCELPELESDTVQADGADVATPADGAPSDAPAEDAASVPEPIPCARLQGQWMFSVCGGNAAIVQFVVAGCHVSLTSPAPELHGGVGVLREGNVLALDLPGGTWGPLRCEGLATTSTVNGRCASYLGDCPFGGVKSY